MAPATRAPGFHPYPRPAYLPAYSPPLYIESHAILPTTRRPGLFRRPPPAPLGAPFRMPQVLGGPISTDHLPPPAGATSKSSSIPLTKGPLLTPPFEKLRTNEPVKMSMKTNPTKKIGKLQNLIRICLLGTRNFLTLVCHLTHHHVYPKTSAGWLQLWARRGSWAAPRRGWASSPGWPTSMCGART